MLSLPLEQLTTVMKGKLISGSKTRKIPLAVGGWQGIAPASITFLNERMAKKANVLIRLAKFNVQCVVITNANYVPIDKFRNAGVAIIKVNRLLPAYMALAVAYRRLLDIPFIQVIGSAGKTTTKDMIGAVLGEARNPMIGPANRNSPVSVASHILSVNRRHQAAVIEAGLLRRGMLSISSNMVRPNIAVVTSIQRSHLIRLGSMKNIIAAKAEILQYMGKHSILILNGEDENIRRLPLHRYKGQILRYGFSPEYDLWASDVTPQGFGTCFFANGKNLRLKVWINTFGKYNVGNALAAILVGLQLGLSENEISRGLAKFQPVEGRLKVHPGPNGTFIINDNFNANPDSTRLLISELRHLAAESPVTLILGDMERPSQSNGKYARQVHFEVGKEVAGVDFKQVWAIGKWGKEYVRGAISAGYPQQKISYFPTVEAAYPYFHTLLTSKNIIVLKASVYTKLDKLILV